MAFNSIDFFFFFTSTCLLYFSLPSRFQPTLLLISSCIFYIAFIPKYLLILLFITFIDYCGALLIHKSHSPLRKKILWLSSIGLSIAILVYFKYKVFILQNLNFSTPNINNNSFSSIELILPIGLSLHVLQSISYISEVYFNRQSPEKNFVLYALYMLYFPKLLAGPIEKPQKILSQLKKNSTFNLDNSLSGCLLIALGLFKKVYIADRLAVITNHVYGAPHDFQGPHLAIATFSFAIQIFTDFSGYCDIARGCSRILGIELSKNFNLPYSSTSVSEFWTRWHITLSNWLKDYLYIPLGGKSDSFIKTHRNLFIVFFISGLWHGANWTYVIWGVINFLYIFFSNFLLKIKFIKNLKLPRVLKQILTFSLICIAWIFFRSQSLSQAFWISTNLFNGWNVKFSFNEIIGLTLNSFPHIPLNRFLNLYLFDWLILLLSILILFVFSRLRTNNQLTPKTLGQKYFLLLILIPILLIGAFSSDEAFIYFQF